MTDSLSLHEARKLVLLSQRVPPAKTPGPATAATLAAIEHLGYIQIDTISVIQRAHHHTLWNRNPRYQPSQLDQLIHDKQVFEYWSHAAACLPMRDYRFSLPRKEAFASGVEEHWFDRDEKLETRVLKRISEEGPLMAKDFECRGKRTGEWKTKPTKRALENLWMQGDLMSARRVNFHKVYDLTERVLPEGTNTTVPTPEEQARFLIARYLQANGLGRPAEVAYLRKGAKPLIADTMQEMTSSGELRLIRVGEENYHVLPGSLELLKKPLSRRKLKILSPFDNLVIQRKRMQALFGFDYLIECYLPAAKRRYGYFTLPILWDGRLAARMDCKAERKESRLHILHLALEPGVVQTDAFFQALCRELESFLTFNQCSRLRLHRTSPDQLLPGLQAAIKNSELLES
ncbi:MAG: crosslink repair DNA glycosylase YcaQ family protein [Verrucomicrobiales bacterium]|nr:crosslink repair DNA glycosylase YcaQ family protein [Verrucomicrobiales bacterium]